MSEEECKKSFCNELGELIYTYPNGLLGIESIKFYNEEESKELVDKGYIPYCDEVVLITYDGGGHHIAHVNGDSLFGMLQDIVKCAY